MRLMMEKIMKNKESNNNIVYEDKKIPDLMNGVFRPGGLELTKSAVTRSGLAAGAKVLDIGCGSGKTVKFLRDELDLRAFGIDKAANMVEKGLAVDETLNLQVASADDLPFGDGCFDAVTAECVFCLLPDKLQALKEISRVLKKDGLVIFSDMYLQRPSKGEVNLAGLTCMQSLMTKEDIQALLTAGGFIEVDWIDCKNEYLGFLGELIFGFDSIEGFWQCLMGENGNAELAKAQLEEKKISYYSGIWRKA